MERDFEYAAIFRADDVKNDLTGCIVSVMDECDEAAILVESRHGINRIAEAHNTYESGKQELRLQIHEDVARQYGIEAEAVETLFNVAAIIKSNKQLSFKESLKIATAIAESYNISRK